MILTKEQCKEGLIVESYSRIEEYKDNSLADAYLILRFEPTDVLKSMVDFEEDNEFCISYGRNGLDDFITYLDSAMQNEDVYIDLEDTDMVKEVIDSQLKRGCGKDLDEILEECGS